MTTNDIEKAEIFLCCMNGEKLLGITDDKILLVFIAGYVKFIQIDEKKTGEISLSEIIKKTTRKQMNILFIITLAFIAGSLITLLFIDKKVIKNIRKPKNKVHFYVARDKDGRLWLYLGKPIRVGDIFLTNSYLTPRFIGCDIENYNLDPKDYANLKWEDEPVEVFLNMEE